MEMTATRTPSTAPSNRATDTETKHPGPNYSTRRLRPDEARRFEVRTLTTDDLVAGIRAGGFEPNGSDFKHLLEQFTLRLAEGDAIALGIDFGNVLLVGGMARREKTFHKKGTKLANCLSDAYLQLPSFHRALWKLEVTEEDIRAASSNPATNDELTKRASAKFRLLYPTVRIADNLLNLPRLWAIASFNYAKSAKHTLICHGTDDCSYQRAALLVAIEHHGEEYLANNLGLRTDELRALLADNN